MKKTFDQTKKETAKISANAFGIRSIAILMFFVMLFTAIGSGSVLSALAVTRGDEGADNSIAESVEVSEDFASSADLYDTEEALLGRKSDSDLAATGAKADLAATGATYYLHYGTDASKNPANTTRVTMTDAGNNTYTASFTAGSSNYFFGINQSTTAGSSFTSSTSFTSTTTSWGQIENGYNNYWATSWASNGSTVYVTYNSSTGAVTASSTSGSSSNDVYMWGYAEGADITSNQAKYKFTATSTNIYQLEYTPAGDFYVWIHSGSNTYKSDYVSATADTEYTMSTSKSDKIGVIGQSGNALILTWNDSTKKFKWNLAETKHDVTFSAGTGGTISPSGTVAVGESTATTVTATANPGYKFSSWTNGTGITQKTNTASGDNQTQTITTKSSGTHTVAANFTKKNLTVTKGTESHGTFSVDKATAQIGDTVTISDITPAKGYAIGTVSTTPSTTVTQSGDDYTFTMPGSAVTVNVTFTAVSYSVSTVKSPNNGGTLYVSRSDSNPGTYGSTTYTIGGTIYYKATAADGYDLSAVDIAYGDGTATLHVTDVTSGTAKSVSMADHTGDVTITANFTKKPVYAITMSTNSSSYGTTASSVAYAYAGQTVTVTATEKDGTFSNWSVLSGGATLASTSSATTTFTMPANAVAIKGNFNEYTGTSEWYYNGYTTSGTDNSYYGKQMTEAKVDGKLYSYYKVDGRSSSLAYNQNFSVSYGNIKYDNVYVKFTRPSNRNDDSDTYWRWSNWDTQYAYFMSSDNTRLGGPGDGWRGMTDKGSTTGGQLFEISVPYGARYVLFKDGNTNHQTVTIDLSGKGNQLGYYLYSDGSHDGDNWKVNSYDTNSGYIGTINEYFNGSSGGIYTNTADHSFKSYNVTMGGTHTLTRPDTNSDSYYVLVLYPGNTYTVNGTSVTVPSGDVPRVVWADELPTTEDPNAVKIYAKDGALRNDSARYTFASIADTKIYDAGGNAVGTSVSYANNQSYETYSAMKGETITIKTIISNGTATGIPGKKYNELFYVVGFCVNGKVPDGTLNKNGIDGGTAVSGGTEYTLTYEIDEDFEGNINDENIIEITPIYYLEDTASYKCVTFYVEGFDGAGTPTNWGDTLFVYPFYGSLSNYSNAFGSYPGQPMVYYGGQYYIQIPLNDTSPFANDSHDSSVDYATRLATNVAGVTLHNGYYDTLHNKLMGYLSDQDTYQTQTYDFDNFYKIYNENSDVNHILFEFRYRTDNDNKSDLGSFGTTNMNVSDFTTTFTNGFEDLKNYHGKQIDLFGTALSGSLLQRNPIYVVSEAGPTTNNIAGYYATQWHIYVPSSETGTATYSKFTNGTVTSIPSSLLILKDEDSFDNTKYPSADSDYSTTDWKAYYTALKAAWKDYPVKITFEKAKGGDSDAATRSDGLWKYATDGENITSNIRVDYTDDNGTTWVTNPDDTTAAAYRSGLEAYFTNSGVSGTRTYATTVDGDKTFDYKAQSTNGSYKFVGWYFDNGTQITSNASGSTSRTRSFTFVARFMRVTSGQLTLSHSTATGSVGGVTYNGSGTALISVSVTNCDSGDTVYSKENESSITLDATYIASDKNYDITVTLTSTASENSTLGTTVLTNPSGKEAKYFANQTPTTVDKTNTYSFTFNVKNDLFNNTQEQDTLSLIYQSYFGLPTFNYKFKFEAKMRDGSTKNYYREGTLTTDEVEEYVTSVYSTQRQMTVKALVKAFVEKLAPHESNFNIDYTWNIADTYEFTGPDDYVYNISSTAVTCTATENLRRTATFSLPYKHTDGVATEETDGTVNKDTAKNFVIDNLTYTQLIKNGEEYVQAPSTIYDAETGKTLYFQYWSVASTKDSATEIARCYYYKFNLVAYDNYIITPVYTETVSTGIKDSGAFTNITYLDTSRNQWNTDGKDHIKTDRENAADLLYNDFVLNYNYNGTEIYLDQADSADVTELGIVIERVEPLAIKGDGSPDTTLSRYAGDGVTADTIKSVINGTTVTGISKHAIAKTALDNKNRIELYEAYYNSAGWSNADQKPMAKYGYKNYVYKAYTYMIVNSVIVLCKTPAYFTMYDEAVL